MCPEVKAIAAWEYTVISMLEQPEWRAKLQARRINEYCSPEIAPSQKLLRGYHELSTARKGKTVVLREEMVKCTVKAIGIGVLACSERLSEITTGKSYFLLTNSNKAAKILLNKLKDESTGRI